MTTILRDDLLNDDGLEYEEPSLLAGRTRYAEPMPTATPTPVETFTPGPAPRRPRQELFGNALPSLGELLSVSGGPTVEEPEGAGIDFTSALPDEGEFLGLPAEPQQPTSQQPDTAESIMGLPSMDALGIAPPPQQPQSSYSGAMTALGGTPEAEALTQPGGTAYVDPMTQSASVPLDMSSPEAYKRSLMANAVGVARKYDLPAEIIAAIPIQEAGYTGSELTRRANNLFSIKGTGPAGSEHFDGVWEVINGQNVYVPADFRKYNSAAESFEDFAKLITESGIYDDAVDVWRRTRDPNAFIQAVQDAGYATDKTWAGKVASIAAEMPQVDSTAQSSVAGIPSARPGNVGVRANPSAGVDGSLDLTPNQLTEGRTLTTEEALAACGPAAAIAFARRNGRNPTLDEAVDLAREVGWTASAGMAGPRSQVRLLEKMGIAASLTGVDEERIAADVQRGNPVTLSTPGHYFVAERYDPASGKFDFGNSASVLKAANGQRWFTLDEVQRLGMGTFQCAIHMDAPDSPSPSVVAGASKLNPKERAALAAAQGRGGLAYRTDYASDPETGITVPGDEPLGGTNAPVGTGPSNLGGDLALDTDRSDSRIPGATAATGAVNPPARDDERLSQRTEEPSGPFGLRLPSLEDVTGAVSGAVSAAGEALGNVNQAAVDTLNRGGEALSSVGQALQELNRPYTSESYDESGNFDVERARQNIAAIEAQDRERLAQAETRLGEIGTRDTANRQARRSAIETGQETEDTGPLGQFIDGLKASTLGNLGTLAAGGRLAGRLQGNTSLETLATEQEARFREVLAEHPEWQRPSEMAEVDFDNPSWYARVVGEGIPSVLGGLAASVLGSMAGAAATRNPIGATAGAVGGGFVFSLLSEGGQQYREGRDAGADPDNIARLALTGGAVSGLIEQLPLFKPLAKLPGGDVIKNQIAKRLLANIAGQGIQEGTEEVLQEVVSNAVARTYDEERDLFDNALAAFAGGALVGSGARAATGGLEAGARRVSEMQPVETAYAMERSEPTGNETTATGTDPNVRYRFRYEVKSLDDLVTSHTDALEENAAFPRELQPRDRGRVGSQMQIDRIARELNPQALLDDVRQIDRGPMIVGPDNIVESGNGRALALRRARQEYPEKWAAYQQELRQRALDYGIPPSAIENVQDPVLVRVRQTKVDRPSFAAEANEAATLQMAPAEQAQQDARRITAEDASQIKVGESQSIDQALTGSANREAVRTFIGKIPENERAGLIDDRGTLNQAGLRRMKAALFAATYQGEAGRRLSDAFTESIDSTVKHVENALWQSLPDMARAEGLIRSGQRAADLSIAEDVSKAVDMLSRLRSNDMPVSQYVHQAALFERETTPFQDELLQFFDGSRSPKPVRELLRGYAEAVEKQASPDQGSLFAEISPPTKEELLRGVQERLERQRAPQPGLFDQPAATEAEGATAAEAGPELARGAEGRKRVTEGYSDRVEEAVLSVLRAEGRSGVGRMVAENRVRKEFSYFAPEFNEAVQSLIDSGRIVERRSGRNTVYDLVEAPTIRTEESADVPQPDRRGAGRDRQEAPEGRAPEGLPGDAERRQPEQVVAGPSDSDAGVRERPADVGDGRAGGLEPGDSARAARDGERLAQVRQLTGGATARGHDFIIDPADLGAERGPAARFDANLEAIRTLKRAEAEGRLATPDEQAVIARFSGWGDSAFEQAFRRVPHPNDDGAWQRRGETLREITTEDEYRAIERSRLNAFFTTPTVVQATWSALARLGAGRLSHPRILEPSAGSGRFLGLQPEELAARSQRTAVELDDLTARMLRQLYPNAEVYAMGFQEAPIANDSIDLAISNVPFGDYAVSDPSFGKGRRFLTRSIHNYFFAKTLDKLRPGGVLAYVTSHNTLDAPTAKPVREYLADRADLVGAIRLPKTAFPDTEVVTDIVILRKRLPGEKPGDRSWVDVAPVEVQKEEIYGGRSFGFRTHRFNVNRYFHARPEMVLGQHTATGKQYQGSEYAVELPEGRSLEAELQRAFSRLPGDLIQDSTQIEEAPRGAPVISAENVKEGAYVVGDDGALMQKRDGVLVAVEDMPKADQQKVIRMLEIRDAARGVLDAQLQDAPEKRVTMAQKILTTAYDGFVSRHGALNSPPNAKLMESDPDGPFLRALEEWDPKTKKHSKMPIFTQRVVRGLGQQTASTPKDAMLVSLNTVGRLDFDRMAELLGRPPDEIRAELAAERLIFRNPEGDWETADQYLTGDVRGKLRAARAAATANPGYQINVKALEAVQPEDLLPSQINVRLGSPWLPNEDVNQFISELIDHRNYERQAPRFFRYVDVTGEWVTGGSVPNGSRSKLIAEWGTERMDAYMIIDKLLNSKPVEVFDRDADDKRIRNEPETVAAQEKAAAIQAEFKRWLWSDTDRATRLARYYNDTFNNLRPRHYDGSHLSLPGASVNWAERLHAHQKDAIWRVIQDGTTLLGHEVGFGKTFEMIAAGMELRRLGLSRKNIYVVPKATHAQFRGQFLELYPYAKILFPQDEDFTPGKRQEFLSRIATGDWDAVIVSDSQFIRIPVKPETERDFLQQQIDEFRDALLQEEAETGQAGRRSRTHKEIEKAIARLEAKLKDATARIRARKEQTIDFEDLGIDQMFVDEADQYKNLQFATRMGRIKGLPNSASERAWDMFLKGRYLLQKGGGRGVTFATGTPVANTIAELWTMMRYLQFPTLNEKGLQHFDAWASTFGETTETIEQTPTGQYRLTQRFAKFVNVPELSRMWQGAADIRVASEVPAMVAERPRLVDEEGRERRTVIVASGSEALARFMTDLAHRADTLAGKDPRDDNMLKISSDARMASLDIRMVDPKAEEDPEGKIVLAVRKIAEIYKETTKERGTQLVFLDMGTPKANDRATTPSEAESDAETQSEQEVLRNVYQVIKDKLIAAGIPAKEIRFIHEAKNPKQKDEIARQVNAGEVRVLIGSTGKMGVGLNVQRRAAALHHLDAPWRPRDIEQREGRIIRQGNLVYGPKRDASGKIIDPGPGVRIYTYVTEGSFDGYMWQAIESKAKAIKALMRRDVTSRTIEDIDSLVLGASEAKALAAGNPDVLKAVTLKNDVQRLQMVRASHLDGVIRAKQQLQSLPAHIEHLRRTIAQMEQDVKLATAGGAFSITVRGRKFSERPEAGEALRDAVVGSPSDMTPEKAPEAARFKGFSVRALDNGGQGFALLLHNPQGDGSVEYQLRRIEKLTLTPQGILQRLENRVKDIPKDLAEARRDLEQALANQKTYGELANKPFPQEERLQKMEAELARLEKKLQDPKADVGAAIEIPEETADDRTIDADRGTGTERGSEFVPPPPAGDVPGVPAGADEGVVESGQQPGDDTSVRAEVEAEPTVQPSSPPTEPESQRFDYSSTQINLVPDLADRVLRLGQLIKDADLAEDGRETEPHITVKYGLHTDSADDVRPLIEAAGPIDFRTANKVSVFTGGDADVVKIDVLSPKLRSLHKKISDTLENTDTHPTFRPHITVAYVKKGRGNRIARELSEHWTEQSGVAESVAFSDKTGTQTEIPLGGADAGAQIRERMDVDAQGAGRRADVGRAPAPARPVRRTEGPRSDEPRAGGRVEPSVGEPGVLPVAPEPGPEIRGPLETDAERLTPLPGDVEPASLTAEAPSPVPVVVPGMVAVVDPATLVFREQDQNNLEGVRDAFPPGEYFPIVVVQQRDGGLAIVDGHNRARVALDRGDRIPVVAVGIADYEALLAAGYDDMEISFAVLRGAGQDDAAQALAMQFPGADVDIRGEDALALLRSRSSVQPQPSQPPPAPPSEPPSVPPIAEGDEDPTNAFRHIVGFGYAETGPEEARRIADIADGYAEFSRSGGVRQADMHQAALELLANEPKMQELVQSRLEESTTQLAVEGQALRVGSWEAATRVTRLKADIERMRASGTASDSAEMVAALQALEIAERTESLIQKASRRTGEAFGRALNMYKHSFIARGVMKTVARLDGLGKSTDDVRAILDKLRSGRMLTSADVAVLQGFLERMSGVDGSLITETSDVAPIVGKIEELVEQQNTARRRGGRVENEGSSGFSRQTESVISRDPELNAMLMELVGLGRRMLLAREARDWPAHDAMEEARRQLYAEVVSRLQDLSEATPRRQRRPQDLDTKAAKQILARARAEAAKQVGDEQEQQSDAEKQRRFLKFLVKEATTGTQLDERRMGGYADRLADLNQEEKRLRGQAVRAGGMSEAISARISQIVRERNGLMTEINAAIERQVRAEIARTQPNLTPAESETAVEREMSKGAIGRLRREIRDGLRFPNREWDRLQEKLDKQLQRSIEDQDITDTLDKIRRIVDLSRTHAGSDIQGYVEIDQLYRELSTMGERAKQRASLLRESLFRAGLRRLDQNLPDDEMASLVESMKMLRAEDPATITRFIHDLRQPNGLEKIKAYTYGNMLSSPMTWGATGVNTAGNVLQVGAYLTERQFEVISDQLFTGGAGGTSWRELPEILAGMREYAPDARRQAWEILRHGNPREAYYRAVATGDIGSVRREVLTERFGKAGLAFEGWSRFMRAGDALFGYTLYGGLIRAEAIRKANKIAKAQHVSADELYRQIVGNLWDHDDVIASAGRIEDWVLLRERDAVLKSIGKFWNPDPNAPLGVQVGSIIANHLFPFLTVTWNFGKQGLERSLLGTFVSGGQAFFDMENGRPVFHRSPERFAKYMGKLMLGTMITGIALALYAGDNLTGDGPDEPDDRELWLQTHRPNSWRLFPGAPWVSHLGTPVSIPFTMLANGLDHYKDAIKAANEQPTPAGVLDAAMAGFGGGVRGALVGFTSQSLVQTVGQLTDVLAGRSKGDAFAASITSRYLPLGSMLNYLARVSDEYERAPKTFTERMAARIPVARQMTPVRQTVLGDPTPNEGYLVRGLVPFRPGAAPLENDPVVREFQRVGATFTRAPKEIDGIPLTPAEQRRFQQIMGEQLRNLVPRVMDKPNIQALPAEVRKEILDDLEESARDIAGAMVVREIGGEEIRRRVRPAAVAR